MRMRIIEKMASKLVECCARSVSFFIDSFEDQRVEKIVVGRIWSGFIQKS